MLNKKYFLNSLFFLLWFIFISCSNQTSRTSNVKKVIEERSQIVENTGKAQVTNQSNLKKQSSNSAEVSNENIHVDLDLSKLNSIVADAELIKLQENKEQYRGIIVKAKGQYTYYKNTDTGNEYYNCVFSSSCCPNGLEFILKDSSKYPTTQGETITVVGSFNYYEEDGYIYYNLIDATIV